MASIQIPGDYGPLLQQFLAAVGELPDVRDVAAAAEAGAGQGADAAVTYFMGERPVRLLVEAKKRIYPRDVQQSLWRLRASAQGADTERLPVLIADSLSPGAKELLRSERIGYFDSGGSLFLPAPGAYIYIDKPAPRSAEKAVRSLFTGRRAQALQVLLGNRHNWFGVKELAQLAQVGASTVSEVFNELERLDWVAVQGQGPSKERLLREPAKLLDTWVQQLQSGRPLKVRRYFVPDLKMDTLPARVAHTFESHQVHYAVTHEAAAQHYAPYLTAVLQLRVRVAPSPGLEAALKSLPARDVEGGANLALIEARSGELQFRHREGDVWLATPIQVYLDLMRSEGRARDLAAHLREAILEF